MEHSSFRTKIVQELKEGVGGARKAKKLTKTSENKFKCSQCGKAFSSKEVLKLHQKRIHGKGRIGKIKLGIKGFDQLFSEGIPVGSATLVEGSPGTGKTIFCLQVADSFCQRGMKALYMSFEEPVWRLKDHMDDFGWDHKEYEKKGLLKIQKFSALDIARSIEALLSEAKRELRIEVTPVFFPKDFDPDVVLIDSLTAIASAFTGSPSRFRIYMEQLFKYLEGKNITSFLIRETAVPTHIGKAGGRARGAVSFLADGIIVLYNAISASGHRSFATEILKMRGEKFEKKIVKADIKGGEGLVVYPEKVVGEDYVLT